MTLAPIANAIELHVVGVPVAQGSITAFVAGGRAIVRQGGNDKHRKRLGDWRNDIAAEARRWLEAHGNPTPIDGPVRLRILFLLDRPASLPKWRWLPWSKPDLDRLARAACDALTHVIYRDDARITDLHLKKRYAGNEPPGCHITIEPLNERNMKTGSG